MDKIKEIKIKEGILKVYSVERFLMEYGECLVVIDAKYVLNIDVVKFAVNKAVKAWKDGRNVAKNLPLEILLYISANRQIKDAVKIGVKEGVNDVVIVVLKEDCENKLKGIFEEKKVLRFEPEKVERLKSMYGITDEEINTVGVEKLPLLIRERIALFDIFKI